jgi:small subunit ribosomal protein S7
MPRKGAVTRRTIEPDLVYGDRLVARLINHVMRQGKKSLAESIVYSALEIVEKRGKESGLSILRKAIENSRPLLEVRPRRVGGATYQIPLEVEEYRGETLALRWLVDVARSKEGAPMVERLANEILEAAKGEGEVIKRRENLHKMAEANRAFAHYRW